MGLELQGEGDGTDQSLRDHCEELAWLTPMNTSKITMRLRHSGIKGGVDAAHEVADSQLQTLATKLKRDGWAVGQTYATIQTDGSWTAEGPLKSEFEGTELSGNVEVLPVRPPIVMPDGYESHWNPDQGQLTVSNSCGSVYHFSNSKGISIEIIPVLQMWEQGSSGTYGGTGNFIENIRGDNTDNHQVYGSELGSQLLNIQQDDPQTSLTMSEFETALKEGDVAAAMTALDSLIGKSYVRMPKSLREGWETHKTEGSFGGNI